MTATIRRFALSAGAGALLGAMVATSVQAADPKLSVRVDWTPWGMHAGLHLAKQKGWFKEAGVEVDISDGKGSSLLMQQVAAGDVDVGWAQIGTMMVAACKGLPVKAVSVLGRAGDLGFMADKSKYKSLADLKGQKLAYAATSGAGPFLETFLKAAGVSKSDFNVVNVDASSLVSVYTSGRAEASFSTVGFFLPIVSKKRPAYGITMASVGIHIPSYGLVSTQKVIGAKAEALKRFVPVVSKAWAYIFESDAHLDEAIDAIASQRPNEKLDTAVMKGQAGIYKELGLFHTKRTQNKAFGWSHPDDMADAHKVLESVNLCKPGKATADFYTNRFIGG